MNFTTWLLPTTTCLYLGTTRLTLSVLDMNVVTKRLSSYCVAPLVEPYCKKIKHFCYKLAEISFFIISDQNLVEYMAPSLG